ncbi:MAG: GNAT family N-acetyltransferase [Casimicrobiaceae bacterium]
MHHYLRPLLAPRSVALVGASQRPGSLGRIVFENLLAGEFKGALYPVNPHHARVLTQRTYGSLAEIGLPIDLAIIATPAEAVPGILERVSKGSLGAAVLMSAPTRVDRAAGNAWCRAVSAIARKRSVRLVGPGALGVIRTDIGLNGTFCAPAALPGRLAIVGQSGAVSAAMLDFAAPLRLGFSTVVTLGGGMDVGFGELLDALVVDPGTDGILLYVETIGDARTFISALRAAARTKPVVVLKAGRSLEARRVPARDAVFDAALMRAGTVRVRTYAQLFAAARILSLGRIPRGDRLGIVSNGRGPAVLAADEAQLRRVTVAKLAPPTVAALDEFLPPASPRTNPVDVRGSASPNLFAEAVRTTLADPGVDAVVALHVARPAIGATDSARAVAAVARESTKPVLGAWLGAVNRREVDEALDAGGVANFYTPETAVDAFSFLASYRRNQAWLLEVPPPQPAPEPPDLALAERIRQEAERDGRTRLAAGDLMALLAAFGIGVPAHAAVETLAEAEAAVRKLHFPVRLTLESDDVTSAASRDVRTREALARAWGELHTTRRGDARAGHTGRVIVARPISSTPAAATAIGVATDAVFGPVILLGDAADGAHTPQGLMLPPLNRRLALDLVIEAHGPLRRGGADVPAEAKREALACVLTQVSTLVCALPWLRALDLRPVVVVEGRAIVTAARAVIDPRRKPQPGYRHMAIHPYPVELVGDVLLADGTPLVVRPIRPEDAELERAFVHGLSDQTRFFRFFYQLHELTPAMLARFTQVDYDRELALVAIAGDPKEREALVGVARYIANPDGESAEFAVVVADDWQRRGVAHMLMERLIAAAHRRGLARIEGTVLRANHNMLKFTAALGFRVRDDPDDAEQVVVARDL